MDSKEWLKHYIEHNDERLQRIEDKIDGLSKFRWQIFGGGILSVFVINLFIQVLTAR